MLVCDFLELCGEAMDVELVDCQTGEATVIDTEAFITGDEIDEWIDDIVFQSIRGWSIKHGRLVIEY